MSDQPNRESQDREPQHHESPDADANPTSPQGGTKDTNDLSGIKQVQQKGMQEKARQVDDLPDSVTGANTGIPQNRR